MRKILFLILCLNLSARAVCQTNLHFVMTMSGTNAMNPYRCEGRGTFNLVGNTMHFGMLLDPCIFPSGGASAIYGAPRLGETGSRILELGRFLYVFPDPVDHEGGYSNEGSVSLSPERVHLLQASLCYVRIRSSEYASGEIRGQILLVPEHDSDADGVPDDQDRYPNTPPYSIVDAHGASIGQLCRCDGPWRNHGDYLRQFARTISRFVHERIITRSDARELWRAAIHSDCGRHGRNSN